MPSKRGSQFAAFSLSPAEFKARPVTAAMKRRRAAAALCLASAADALAELDRGASIFGLTKGQFSLIDLASAVLDKTGPGDVSVWTWCVAEYEVEAFTSFFNDGRIASLRVVMDWGGVQRDMPLIRDLQEKFGVDCLRATKTHAKIITVSNAGGWRVVVRGSMNLNANPRFEQFDVSDCPSVFDVVEAMRAELWARGKSLPAEKLEHRDAADLLDAGEVDDSGGPDWGPPDRKWW